MPNFGWKVLNLTEMSGVDTNDKPAILKVLDFFNNLQLTDPLLYSQYIRKIIKSETQQLIKVEFDGGYITFQSPTYHSKSNRIIINIGGILHVPFGHLRKWVPTQLTYDEICCSIKDPWQEAINQCKILKKIKLINFKSEFLS